MSFEIEDDIWNTVGGDVHEIARRTEQQNKELRKQQLETARKVDEIHAFIQGLSQALNNPMIQAMIPAHLRNSLGG